MKNTDNLTEEDILRAVKSLREASKQPFLTSISSNKEVHTFYKDSQECRTFFEHLYIYQDSEVPEGMARFNYSDGTHKDLPITQTHIFLKK